MDMGFADNLYDSFCYYQSQLITQFDQMADEFGFITIDANKPVQDVFHNLTAYISPKLKT